MWRVTLPPPEVEWEQDWEWSDEVGMMTQTGVLREVQTNRGLYYAVVEYRNDNMPGFKEGVKFSREGECVVCIEGHDFADPHKVVGWAWERRRNALLR